MLCMSVCGGEGWVVVGGGCVCVNVQVLCVWKGMGGGNGEVDICFKCFNRQQHKKCPSSSSLLVLHLSAVSNQESSFQRQE